MKHEPGDAVSQYVASIGRPVTAEDVDTYERLSQIEARSEEGRGQRRLRTIYGTVLLGLLSAQVIAVTVFAFLMGFNIISIDRWVTTTFVGGTLGEVSGMIFLIVRHLFPAQESNSRGH